MQPVDILKAITSGKTVLHPVTIPEGYRITEIAKLLAEKISINKEAIVEVPISYRGRSFSEGKKT